MRPDRYDWCDEILGGVLLRYRCPPWPIRGMSECLDVAMYASISLYIFTPMQNSLSAACLKAQEAMNHVRPVKMFDFVLVPSAE